MVDSGVDAVWRRLEPCLLCVELKFGFKVRLKYIILLVGIGGVFGGWLGLFKEIASVIKFDGRYEVEGVRG